MTDSFADLPPSSSKHHYGTTEKLIPRIIHQTSKSRCLTPKFIEIAKPWKDRVPGYEYYLWDDEAVEALLSRHFPEFPHLSTISRCLDESRTTIRADLWRYVVLWEYGGIYADLDSTPNSFNDSTIPPKTDAFFVIENYGLLSQYFMAVSPRHPLMYYTIHQTLSNMISAADPGQWGAPGISGPHALHNGFSRFMRDGNVTLGSSSDNPLPVGGHFFGSFGRSVTAVGSQDKSTDIVIREAIKRVKKKREYAKMGMVHFREKKNKVQSRENKHCDTIMLEDEARRMHDIKATNYSSKFAGV